MFKIKKFTKFVLTCSILYNVQGFHPVHAMDALELTSNDKKVTFKKCLQWPQEKVVEDKKAFFSFDPEGTKTKMFCGFEREKGKVFGARFNQVQGHLLIAEDKLDIWQKLTKENDISLFKTVEDTLGGTQIYGVFSYMDPRTAELYNILWIPTLSADEISELTKKATIPGRTIQYGSTTTKK